VGTLMVRLTYSVLAPSIVGFTTRQVSPRARSFTNDHTFALKVSVCVSRFALFRSLARSFYLLVCTFPVANAVYNPPSPSHFAVIFCTHKVTASIALACLPWMAVSQANADGALETITAQGVFAVIGYFIIIHLLFLVRLAHNHPRTYTGSRLPMLGATKQCMHPCVTVALW
jgi:hypothetical protein